MNTADSIYQPDVDIKMRAGSRENLNTAVTSGGKRGDMIVGLLGRSATVKWCK